jgi:Wiskott-Aldrich syndrome protein
MPTSVKTKDGALNGLPNGKGKETTSKVLQDARLYATWDYEQKDYNMPLTLGRRGRNGSVQGGPSGLSLVGTGGRGRSGSKMG